MSKAILGIDIAKAKFDIVLVRPDGRSTHRVFQNNQQGFEQVLAWLGQQNIVFAHACLEATGRYGQALAHFLYRAGYQVSVVNPARIKKYAASQLRRCKTDKADATIIADFCRTQSVRLWQPPDPAHHELQAMVRHLASLQTSRQQEANRLCEQQSSLTVMAALQEHLVFLAHQITTLKRDIQRFIEAHPHLKIQRDLLTSIVGFGQLTAARFLAEVHDIHAFETARQLAAYAGAVPAQYQSGSSIHKPAHLIKTGNAHLRNALYFPAIVAKLHNPIIRAFCQRLLDQGKPPKLVIAAAMRKLLHLAFGVLHHQQPFDPHYLAKLHPTS
jgi:transposase